MHPEQMEKHGNAMILQLFLLGCVLVRTTLPSRGTWSTNLVDEDPVFSPRTMTNDHSVVSLEGKWEIELLESNKTMKLHGEVPGNIYTALYRASLITYPYYGENDEKYRWVGRKDWKYSRNFSVSSVLLGMDTVNIIFEGLDTASRIYINGKFIGQSTNMFVKYIFSVKDILKQGENSVAIYFQSPIQYATEESSLFEKKYGYMVPPVRRPLHEHGDEHVNFIRKEPCSFGWDWGPSFPTVGIWKSVYLEACHGPSLDYILVNSLQDEGYWKLETTLITRSYSSVRGYLWRINIEGLGYSQAFPANLDVGESASKVIVKLSKQYNVSLWWPRGYGNQSLFTLNVSLENAEGGVVAVRKIMFGFRTIELVEEKIEGSSGLSFYFKINSVPVFLKGSNWIPADSFKDNVTEERVKSILQSAYDANMNVLRVWGGGVYEDDYFYSMADKMGILIWHDFMFACALYPANDFFLKNVTMEIRHQVRRLQHHPSILLWSGNNENEVALRQDWYHVLSQFERFKKDYDKLYISTIKKVVAAEDGSRPFIPSSPSNGQESEKEGGIAADPQSPLWGDVHFYDYYGDCLNVNTFPKPRMATEYGYQSYPSYDVLRQIAEPSELAWDSKLMKYRQHHENGNEQIQNMIEKHFKLPEHKNATEYFKGMIYLSQIMQALCIKQETENYRRMRGNLIKVKEGSLLPEEGLTIRKLGMGHTMGAMYWQLNDIWQGPSWSSVEYGGGWKMLHYYAKDFFANVIASAYEDHGKVYIYVISDRFDKIDRALLQVRAYTWESFTPTFKNERHLTINPASSTLVETLMTNETCRDPSECIMTVHVVADGAPSLPSPVFVTSPKKAQTMRDPVLKIKSVSASSQSTFSIEIEARFPAAFVWLSASLPGRFSDNGFLLLQPQIEILFQSPKPVSSELFRKSVRITSLYNLYH